MMKSLSAKGACIVQVADDAGVGWRPSLEYVTSLQRSVGVPEPEGAG